MNRLPLIALIITIMLSLLPKAQAADIETSGTCTLADAITAANTDEAAGECPAGDGADTVTLSGNVRLSRALPLVTSNMTIEGGGFTISGNGRTHIIGVNNRGTLTINEVTITNGRAGWGGAIGNFGKLTITNSTVTRNSAEQGGAIGNDGALTIRNSTIDNNMAEDDGGAIYIDNGTLTIINTRVNNNNLASTYGDGGAIYNDNGTLTITDSTFNNNSAGDDGGVIYSGSTKKTNIASSAFIRNSAGDRGGAIFIIYGEHTLTDSTFNGNSADGNGGAIYNWEDLIITNSTFSNNSTDGNGGAIYNRSDLTINSSTFSGNSAAEDGGGLYQASDSTVNLRNSIIASSRQGGDCYGRLNTNTSNLIEDGSCYAELSDDPMLGELVEPDDGSPAYYPLLEGSPAIDASSRSCPSTDQIGTVRPQGAACDIGAYERPGK